MKRSAMVLKGILSKKPENIQQALSRFLPEAERLFLKELPPCEPISIPSGLEAVHWSWFLPTLKTYSPKEQKLFLAALNPQMAESLGAELSLGGPQEEITEVAKEFLRDQLLHSLAEEQILPPDYLPTSPLNQLLTLSKKDLTRLIDFLALYDLSSEFKQIVETKILKKIYSFLSEEQRMALGKLAVPKEPLPRLNLDRWDGTEESFKNLLHKRGLMRLGLALSGQDRDLIWSVCHHLDIGRGSALFKMCTKEPAPEAVRQVTEIMSML